MSTASEQASALRQEKHLAGNNRNSLGSSPSSLTMPQVSNDSEDEEEGEQEERAGQEDSYSPSLHRYNKKGQMVTDVDAFNNGQGGSAGVVGQAGASKRQEKKQPEKNEGNFREQKARALKHRMAEQLLEMAENFAEKRMGKLGKFGQFKDVLNGDFVEVGKNMLVKKIVTEVWLAVIPSWGLAIFVLDAIWVYDATHGKLLPMWQKMAIALVTLVYLTLIAIILAAIYEYYSVYFKIALGIARSLGIVE